jgi:hypothetical protein
MSTASYTDPTVELGAPTCRVGGQKDRGHSKRGLAGSPAPGMARWDGQQPGQARPLLLHCPVPPMVRQGWGRRDLGTAGTPGDCAIRVCP